MKIITLPVSKFVAEVAAKKYGTDCIALQRWDVLHLVLQCEGPSSKKRWDAALDIQCSDSLARHIESRMNRVGALLQRLYEEEMMAYTLLKYRAGSPAKSALREWLDEHEVSDEGMNLDSAYRAWKRRKRRNKTKSLPKNQKCVPIRQVRGKEPRTIQKAVARNADMFQSEKQKRSMMYFLFRRAGWSYRLLVEGGYVQEVPERTFNHAAAQMKFQVQIYDDMRQIYEAICDDLGE